VRAQSLGFEKLPDPHRVMPLAVPIRVLLPFRERLLVGGDFGALGQLSPRGTLCAATSRARLSMRFLTVLGDEIIGSGAANVAGEPLLLVRFTVTP